MNNSPDIFLISDIVIISYYNLQLVKRHAAEIFTSVIISTLFSLYSTALIGRLIGLEPSLTISVLPRCITVALALSIVSFFEGWKLTLFYLLHPIWFNWGGYKHLANHLSLRVSLSYYIFMQNCDKCFPICFRCQFISYSSCCCSNWTSWGQFCSDNTW